MSVIVHILLGLVLSFIGSIPFGTINVTVIESAITKGFRAAVSVIFGAAMIEFVQAVVALKFSDLISRNPLTEQILFWISIPIFVGLGIYYLRQKTPEDPQLHGYSKGRGFVKGVVVSSLNVLAIPYWIFYGTYLTSVELIDPSVNNNIAFFSFGVFTGTVIILMTYARLGIYAKTKFNKITKHITPAAAFIFFALALIQIIRAILRLSIES